MVHSSPAGRTKTLSILGSTGSIGVQTLDVVRDHPDLTRINWLTTNRRIEDLERQALEFSPKGVVIADQQSAETFRANTRFKGRILSGHAALEEAAADADNDLLMSALVGFSGVRPTMAAMNAGVDIALANKETLVSAGEPMMRAAATNGINIYPVDSEHSALAQCMVGESSTAIERLILTASGGPFRRHSLQELQHATCAQALKHPNWSMGSKITIDSATLMNKGFEVIEARWLFDVDAARIDVLVHPQSIIHSMVQYVDGSVKAQLGLPDMKLPILYALVAPERVATNFERMNLADIATLTFEAPDYERFPCLRLAFDALAAGGTATAIVNAANEIAVAAFLQEKIAFMDIPRLVDAALNKIVNIADPSLDDIFAVDAETRTFVSSNIQA